jgi:hypothetical protein
MTASTDPLARLVVDQVEVDRELLASILADLVRVDPARGTFAFQHQARRNLGSKKTVIVALLARKALCLLGASIPEALLPKDIEALTGIKGNSLRPLIKQLADSGIIQRVDDGYVVPNFAIEDVAREIKRAR